MSDAMTREQFEYDVETVFAQSNLITKDRFLAHDTALRQEIERLTAANIRLRDIINLPLNEANRRLAQAEQERERLRDWLEQQTTTSEDVRIQLGFDILRGRTLRYLQQALTALSTEEKT